MRRELPRLGRRGGRGGGGGGGRRRRRRRAQRAESDATLDGGADAIEAAAAALRDALAAEVGAACAARLAPVKTIGAAFRVSGKALPTAPSFFVAEILGPLRDFLGAHTSELELSGETPAAGWRAAEWAAAVGDHVCDAYKALAEASLDTVRKNEEALRRLHAKRDGSGAKEGEVADSAKIAAQLLLDVDALGDRARRVGRRAEERELREAARGGAPDASAVAQLSGS